MDFNPSRAVLVTFSSGAVGHSPIHWSGRGHLPGILQASDTDVSSRVPFIAPETTGCAEAPALFQGNNESKTLSSHKSWLDLGHEADFLAEWMYLHDLSVGEGDEMNNEMVMMINKI